MYHYMRCSLNPALWLQDLVALSTKAKEGQAGRKLDTMEAYSGKVAGEGTPDARHKDQDEHVLRHFLSPKVCMSLLWRERLVCVQTYMQYVL